MAEVKHTPWEEVETESSVDLEGCSGWQDIADQAGRTVAIAIGWDGWRDADLDRRARLIAAAPDLFEALEAILNTSGARKSGYNSLEYSKAVALAENALSKATAQQEGR